MKREPRPPRPFGKQPLAQLREIIFDGFLVQTLMFSRVRPLLPPLLCLPMFGDCGTFVWQFSHLAEIPYPPSYQRFLNLLDVFSFGEKAFRLSKGFFAQGGGGVTWV